MTLLTASTITLVITTILLATIFHLFYAWGHHNGEQKAWEELKRLSEGREEKPTTRE